MKPMDQRVRKGLENMVYGAFGRNEGPLFDKGRIPFPLLEEFVQSDLVIDSAERFAKELMRLWKDANPGKPPLKLARPANRLVGPKAPYAQPEFASKQESPLNPNSGQHNQLVNSTPLDSTARPGSVPPAGSAPGRPADPAAIFQAPNAKAGLAYIGKIAEAGASPRPIQLRNVRLPADLGLSFMEGAGELVGTPVVAGDHEILFQWSENGSAWFSGKCVLIVNPDPRTLWKIIEPPTDAPYRKQHSDGQSISAPGFKIAAASRRGRSHEHSGTFRDDDFFINHDASSGWSVIIVADGAGSAKSSRWGSKLAVKAAGEHLVSHLAGDFGTKMSTALNGWDADPDGNAKAMGGEFHYLFHKAASLAVQAIEAEAQSQGTPVKDYSTTLLAAVVSRQGKETFLSTFWMGDGAIAAYGPRGKVRLMGAPDGGEYAGQTRFLDRAALSDLGFSKRIRIGRYPDISSVMLMTDGISDPRFETDNGLADATKWDELWDEIAPRLASPEPDKSLVEWLDFFTPGHHDDRTIALLW
jgi:hypothetical protein